MRFPPVFVLTNDDGIDAPGLAALDAATGGRAIVVAPRAHLSGCSHQVTVDRPIAVEQRGERHYAVDGTPADCVRLALWRIAPEAGLILSGINRGGNLGADVYLSGTVAAVREAAFHRRPGVAVSQYLRRGAPIDWERAASLAARALAHCLEAAEPEAGEYWNVNLPHLPAYSAEPAIAPCDLCTQPLPVAYTSENGGFLYEAGAYQDRRRDPGADVARCFAGAITVTRLRL